MFPTFRSLLAVVAGIALLPSSAVAGELEGKVLLPESKGKSKTYNDARYPGSPNAKKVERVRGPAVVFLEPVDGTSPPAGTPERRKMEQRNRQFHPLLLPVAVGSTVEFPNYDDEYHNVFSRSEAKELELGRYGKGETKEVTFDRSGVVRLRCEVHSAMHAVIVILETPYWAVTDEAGNYRLQGIPAGKYRAYAFQEDAKPRDKSDDPLRAFGHEVEVKPDGAVQVEFDLRAAD